MKIKESTEGVNMNTNILIATHGDFAEGIFQSLQMITGIQTNVERLCCYNNPDIDYGKEIERMVKSHVYTQANLLVITDLLGGSVNNEFMKYINDYPFFLVSGLQLGLLLECVLQMDHLDEDKIRSICDRSKNFTVLCNDCLENTVLENDF